MLRAFYELLFEDVRRGDERWSRHHAVAACVLLAVLVAVIATLHYCRRFVLGY